MYTTYQAAKAIESQRYEAARKRAPKRKDRNEKAEDNSGNWPKAIRLVARPS